MPSYSDVTLDHFHNPRNAFRLDGADAVGTAGNPEKGGPFMVVYLKLAGDQIAKASYQTYGCCAAIAAGSVLVERLQGLRLMDAPAWTENEINEALGGLPVEKRHCSALASRALLNALERAHELSQTVGTPQNPLAAPSRP